MCSVAGFVFKVNDDKDVDGREDVGVAVIRAYNFAKEELKPDQAFSFLANVSNPVLLSSVPLSMYCILCFCLVKDSNALKTQLTCHTSTSL